MNLKELVEALCRGKDNNEALFAEGRAPEQWTKGDPDFHETLREVRMAAEEYIQRPVTEISYSLYRQFDTTGERAEYEKAYFERRGRLNAMAFMVLCTGEDRYLTALLDIIWAICGEYTWALPACLYGKSLDVIEPEYDFSGYPADRRHDEVVDLFAAETAFALSEIVSLVGNRVEPVVAHRVKREVIRRVIQPYYSLNTCFPWETCNNNWAAVCAGSVGAAAMYTVKDNGILAKILLRVLNTLECYMDGFDEDGACREGVGYWSYGTTYYLSFAELLKQRTAGRVNLMDNRRWENITMFLQRCILSGDKVVNFSDSSSRLSFREGFIHRMKDYYPKVCPPPFRYKMHFGDDHCHRWAGFIRDILWGKSEYRDCVLISEPYYHFKGAQWFVSRRHAGGSEICFAAKGGHNGESHNHNDIGHFIYAVNGRIFFIDLGGGRYTKQYFGKGRYEILNNGSQGHSVPIVGGHYQKEGPQYGAGSFEVTVEKADTVVTEIATAYNGKLLESLERKFFFHEDGRLVITDSIKAAEPFPEVVERFMVACTSVPVHKEDDQLLLVNDGSGVVFKFDKSAVGPVSIIKTEEAPNNNQEVFILDFRVKKNVPAATFEIFPCKWKGDKL